MSLTLLTLIAVVYFECNALLNPPGTNKPVTHLHMSHVTHALRLKLQTVTVRNEVATYQPLKVCVGAV